MAYEDNNPSTPRAVRQMMRESRDNARDAEASLRDQMREEEQARKAEAVFGRQSKRLGRVMDRQRGKTERLQKKMDEKARLRAEAEAALQEQMADEQKRLMINSRNLANKPQVDLAMEPSDEDVFLQAIEDSQNMRREAELLRRAEPLMSAPVRPAGSSSMATNPRLEALMKRLRTQPVPMPTLETGAEPVPMPTLEASPAPEEVQASATARDVYKKMYGRG